jgi:endonuclease G
MRFPALGLRLALAALLLATLAPACKSPGRRESEPAIAANRNVRYGLPSPATCDPANRTDYLIERPEFVLSYNDGTKCPNWVCWHLTGSDIGDSPRGSFEADPLLPPGFQRVTSNTYDGSGFDRGHMCNSKDRSDTPERNDTTFYMTNMVPQAPNNNQQGWEEFESYCRGLVRDGAELFIVAGPAGSGGEGKAGYRTEIGSGSVSVCVPSHVWKVVMVLPGPDAKPAKSTRMIGLWMPNDQSVTTDWTPYVVSVRDIEERTGYTFFPQLPADVAKAAKSRLDSQAAAAKR